MKRLIFTSALLIIGALNATRSEYAIQQPYTGPLFSIEKEENVEIKRTVQDPANPRRPKVLRETEVRKTQKEVRAGDAVSYGIHRNDLELIREVESQDGFRHLTLEGLTAAAHDADKLARHNDRVMVTVTTIGSAAVGLFISAAFTLPHEHLKKHVKALGLLIGGALGGAFGFAHAKDHQYRAEGISDIVSGALQQQRFLKRLS